MLRLQQKARTDFRDTMISPSSTNSESASIAPRGWLDKDASRSLPRIFQCLPDWGSPQNSPGS